ncbi:MAG: BON domain-containing protein [Vicinamibacterales bacterium]
MRSWLLVGTLAVTVAACQRSPDIEGMATGALESAALQDAVDAAYDESTQVVRLTGTVDTSSDRDRALDVVRASVGNRAQIANEIVVTGMQAEMADDLDDGIETRFDTQWKAAPEAKNADVDLRVENGVVTLTGEVPTATAKTRAEEVARSIPGVKDVVNALEVNADPRDTMDEP